MRPRGPDDDLPIPNSYMRSQIQLLAGKEPEPQFSCELYSVDYFKLCAMGGAVSCGSTHTFITPLDLIKCRMQVDSKKYPSLPKGFKVTLSEGGVGGLVTGWAPTLIGYSLQGMAKFAGYEYFKHLYSDMAGPERAYYQRTYLYLAASASAEMIADCFLAPFEATKVRMQTTPGFTTKMREAMPKMMRCDGFGVFYRGLPPLWGRQVPYTMMKFASFERVLEYLYKIAPKPRSEMNQTEQLMVTFSAGYIAGVLCAIVSHPADTIVSKMNRDPTAGVGTIIGQVGFLGIWRGLVARIIMIGTLTGLQWFIYDGFKVYTKMPRPPPPAPPPPKN